MPPLKTQSFLIPKIVTTVLVGALVVGALYYVLFQARFLIGGPQITLTELPESVQTKQQITLTGTASNITAIYLNGRAIVTNESGVFTESVILQTGHNRIRIDAQDRYGRTTFVEEQFVYTPPEPSLQE